LIILKEISFKNF